MEKILNLQRGWKSRLWFGEKAFALCFVIFTAFTGLVSVNAGPGVLYESHTFRTILNVMLTAAAYVIAIDLVYNMMFNFSQRFYQSIVIEEAIAIIPFIVGLIILYVFSCGKTVADLMYFKTIDHYILVTCNYLHTYRKLYLRPINSTMWMCFGKHNSNCRHKNSNGNSP